MILEKQSQSIIHETGAAKDSIGMSLDLDSAQVLMQMLSKNLYSDAIGSTIRECASNALDSHRRAGVDDPIIVSFGQSSSSNYEFTVEDFGIGLDDKDVENIISKYGKSTKRQSATELGMMGLGFKSPLAYSSSFYFTCRKDGVERKYMMYEGEEVNTIDLLYEKPTVERNGVKVIIPVNYYDRSSFTSKIREQLAYFQNVYFNVEGLNNDFSIYRGENYQISEIASDRSMHICLDDVYYPIDWKKLDMPSIDIPLGLRFSLTDGLFPTPNREALIYTPEAKTKIKAKIISLADEFVNKYNETVEESSDFETVFQYYSNRIIQIQNPIDDGSWLDITKLSTLSNIVKKDPKVKDVHLLDLKQMVNRSSYILQEYEYRHMLHRGWKKTFSNLTNDWDRKVDISRYGKKLSERNIYIFEDRISERSKRYIKETFSQETYFLKKVKSIKLWNVQKDEFGNPTILKSDVSTYYGLLDLYNYPRHSWRQLIQEFQCIVKEIVKEFKDFNDIVIPEAWIIADKKSRAKVKVKDVNGYVKVKGDISAKIASPLERYNQGNNCKFVPIVFKADALHLTKKLVVYGKDSDRSELDKWYGWTNRSQVDFVILSDRETSAVQSYNLHNWVSVSKFLEGNNKVYRRAISTSLINALLRTNDSLHDNLFRSYFIGDVLKGLPGDLKELHHYRRINRNSNNDYVNDSIVEVALSKGLVDTNIHYTYQRVNKLLSTNPFIESLQNCVTYDRVEAIKQVLIDMCRYHKVRMSKENYNITSGWQPVDEFGQLSLFVA